MRFGIFPEELHLQKKEAGYAEAYPASFIC
jgi:hypothetical protein